MNKIHAEIWIDGTPSCERCGCPLRHRSDARLLFAADRRLLWCSQTCFERDMRDALRRKDDRIRADRAIGKRDLLRELSPAEDREG